MEIPNRSNRLENVQSVENSIRTPEVKDSMLPIPTTSNITSDNSLSSHELLRGKDRINKGNN